MKIGIFGDSFADAGNEIKKQAPYCWFNIFANQFSEPCQVGVHGVGASSLFFSYQKFLKQYQDYDVIVFCVTGATRYPKPLVLSDGQVRHYCGFGAIDNAYRYLGNKITNDDERTLNHLKGYFIMNVDEYCWTASDLMMNHMSSLHPKVIFYPNFPDSFTKERFQRENIPQKYLLFEMYKKQLKLMGISEDANKDELDTIVGHLVHEYNTFFGNLLYKKYTKGVWDFTGYDDITSVQMPNDYYYKFW